MAADIIGQDDFLEVYVSTPLEECERRDVKGLYAKHVREKSRILLVFPRLLRSRLIRSDVGHLCSQPGRIGQ